MEQKKFLINNLLAFLFARTVLRNPVAKFGSSLNSNLALI